MATRLEAIPLWTAQLIESSEALTSDAIMCTRGDPEYLLVRVVGTGAAAVKIEYQISGDGVNFNEETSQDPIVLSTATEFASPKNPEDWHVIVCPGAPWIKLVVTELSGTVADTALDVVLWMRNDVTEMR